MVGQGSPRTAPRPVSLAAWLVCAFASGIVVNAQPTQVPLRPSGAQLADPPTVSPADMNSHTAKQRGGLEFRVRIAWGGGQPRQWQGHVTVAPGDLGDLQPLGLHSDAARSCYLQDNTIHLEQARHHDYDAFDVSIRGSTSSTLKLQMQSSEKGDPGRGEPPEAIEIPLADLLSGVIEKSLDLDGNRLLVRRVPGDNLRVSYQHPSLLFSPGENFQLTAQPHHAGLQAETSYRCYARLTRTSSGELIQELEPAMAGSGERQLPTIEPIRLTLPNDPGVYDLTLSIHPRRFTDRFVRSKPILTRSLQLVVISTEPGNPVRPDWTEVLQLDLANPDWWRWLEQLTHLKVISGWADQPIDNGRTFTANHGNRKWTRLEAGGWQAIPLPLSEPAAMHEVTIEFPGDLVQSLSARIVEPDRAGRIGPLGPQAGVERASPRWADWQDISRSELAFWPQTNLPLLLVHNRHKTRDALFGTIRVRRQVNPPGRVESVVRGRMVSAYYAKPLFAENLGSSESPDPVSQTSLDDWRTFYDGGERLVQYLPYAGFNSAIVTIGADGSFLYPSRLAPATPRYDSGIFFESGQDPERKDVLEMLFRQFDRAGFQLIPAITFDAPLPQLEALLRKNPDARKSVLLKRHDSDARSAANAGSPGPLYNPLDKRVQSAMHAVVTELVERYSHHPSFAGIAIQFTPASYTQLPTLLSGADSETLRRFLSERGQEETDAENVDLASSPWHDRWIDWRCEELAGLYRGMARDLQSHSPGSQLILCSSQLLSHPVLRREMRPGLPSDGQVDSGLEKLGLKPTLLAPQRSINWLRPTVSAPLVHLPGQPVQFAGQWSESSHRLFTSAPARGLLIYHRPQTIQLPEFARRSPFGQTNTHTAYVSSVVPAGFEARKTLIRGLAAQDLAMVAEGGWLLPMGQESTLRRIRQTLQQLPAQSFKDALKKQPVIVRQASNTSETGDDTHFYLVNTAPWPATAELAIRTTQGSRLTLYDNHGDSQSSWTNDQLVWSVQLEPYDLRAARINNDQAIATSLTVKTPDSVRQKLLSEVHQVNRLTAGLAKPQAVAVLGNAGFESAGPAGRPRRWIDNSATSATVKLDARQPHEGQTSLKLQRSTPAGRPLWVRSDPFPPPSSGRMAVSVWLRTRDVRQQPSLRLAIEARHHGDVYYRPRTVGRAEAGQDARTVKSIGDKWTPFLLLVDDLPPSGLSDMRVGFDLMSGGEVWIDSVRIYDSWFQQSEQRELLRNIALAYAHCNDGRVADCEHFLDSYWPRYLRQFTVPGHTRVARLPLEEEPTTDPQPDSTLDQLRKRYFPDRLFPF